MKTMMLAAAAALSLGVGSAYADSEGHGADSGFPAFSFQTQTVNPADAGRQTNPAVHAYVTNSNRNLSVPAIVGRLPLSIWANRDDN